MALWRTDYLVSGPLPGLPQPRCTVQETRGPGYRILCRERPDGFHLLKVTLAGFGELRVADRVYILSPGQAFLCRVNDPQVEYGFPGASGEWEFLFFTFHGGEELVREIIQRQGSPVFNLGTDNPAIGLLRAQEVLAGKLVQLPPGQAATMVLQLLSPLADRKEGSSHSGLIARARARIDATLASGLSVTILAGELGISREHLARIFQRELGVSPFTYIQQQRMRHACNLLLETDFSVKEIAGRMCFESSTQFIRVFHRQTGMTPGVFRRKGGASLL